VDTVQRYIRLVESAGQELAVTIMVGGVVITGMLTPWDRYQTWQKEVLMRAARAGGKAILPSDPMAPISPTESERARGKWDQKLREEGVDADDEDVEVVFRNFAVRDARVEAGVPMNWVTYPYLAVNAEAVQTFFPGWIGREREG
jgi:hypothetical protein